MVAAGARCKWCGGLTCQKFKTTPLLHIHYPEIDPDIKIVLLSDTTHFLKEWQASFPAQIEIIHSYFVVQKLRT